MNKFVKEILFSAIALSGILLFPKASFAAQNINVHGYLINNAQIHQSPNAASKVQKTISLKNFEGHDLNTDVPALATQKDNNMYKITYEGVTGYADSNNFIVKNNFNKSYNFSHYTRQSADQIDNDAKNKDLQVPNFKGINIKDIPSAQSKLKLNEYYYSVRDSNAIDVISSWPVQNKDGTVANYNGYRLVIAVTRDQNGYSGQPPAHLYLFYQKIDQANQGTSSWHNAGPIFKTRMEGASFDDKYLHNQTDELAGSAYQLDGNNQIRLFYTDYSGDKKLGGTGNNSQVLTTANIPLTFNNNDLAIDHSKVNDHKSIYTGQGVTYQSDRQFFTEWPDNWELDNLNLRDPHYVEDGNNKYLIFGADTGSSNGYQGNDNLYNQTYLGHNRKEVQKQQDEIFSDKNKLEGLRAQFANGAIGIIKLNDNYTLSSVKQPLIAFNTVFDQIRRPNLVKLNGRFYLFGDISGQNTADNHINPRGNYMLGFVSDSLEGPYRPLNGNGVVLSSKNFDFNDRKYNFDYYAFPNQNNGNSLMITDTVTNPGVPQITGGHSTFGPSFQIKINGDQTKVIKTPLVQGRVNQ